MPELPEVESIRAQLQEILPGRTVARVQIDDPRLVLPADPQVVENALVGRSFTSIERRGKYLMFVLDDGQTAVAHLRMTGQIHWHAEPGDEPRHLRARVDLAGGGALLMCDMRRFGTLTLVSTDHARGTKYWHGRVGVEPLGSAFTAQRLSELLAGRQSPIKAALLNQALVAGIGNIYADEALFAAGVHPERTAGSLTADEIGRLHRAIRDRLRVAVAAGGSSIDRYRDTRGERGAMQTLLKVHLRAGRPCLRCGEVIIKMRVAQRGTYICPSCQVR